MTAVHINPTRNCCLIFLLDFPTKVCTAIYSVFQYYIQFYEKLYGRVSLQIF